MKSTLVAFIAVAAIPLISLNGEVRSQTIDQQFRNQEAQDANMDNYCNKVRSQKMFNIGKYARMGIRNIGGFKVDDGIIYALYDKDIGSTRYPECEWGAYVRIGEQFRIDGGGGGIGLYKIEDNTICFYQQTNYITRTCERLR